jgi:hypothetical protein
VSWRALIVIAIAASLPVAADAAPARKKVVVGDRTVIIVHKFRQKSASPPGVGFLPGYRTPEQLRRIEYRPRYWYAGGWRYFGRPQWYGGRWNGGSFGPCWTASPIGMQWTCGR